MRIAFIDQIKAFLGGYFWRPCRNCGRMFGGHERGGDLEDPSQFGHGWMTCTDSECMKNVKERNAATDEIYKRDPRLRPYFF